MNDFNEKLYKSIQKVSSWVENHEYKGYEPFEGLSSYLRPLTFDNLFAQRVLQQVVLRSPFNIRPLLGIKPKESTKGRGYMAKGYLRLWKITKDHKYKDKAVECLEWLMKNKSSNYSNYSWGNHFDFASRGGKLPKNEPIIVWTSLIGQVFLDAYEILENNEYLDVAKSICDWILNLPREQTDSGTCLSYVSFGQSSIHNSNMLGSAMLARTAKFTKDNEALKVAHEAMKYSCSRQLPDGSWYYGENKKFHWIDNFHTGYNLDSLKCYIDNTDDKSFEDNLTNGFGFFKKNFFEKSGRPKYFHDQVYPVDIQCVSQAIDTLAYLSENDESSLELSTMVAKWAIDNMQDKNGFFYYRELPWKKVKIPMLHWGQATMFSGMTNLLVKMNERENNLIAKNV